ncbi:hypothetical protein HMPREF1584_00512 [Gardnerella vaginalis JCP8481A]|nr:hypothetical protein HMPREF1584_00512 [Gardnerella vaginalis JCP8481A]
MFYSFLFLCISSYFFACESFLCPLVFLYAVFVFLLLGVFVTYSEIMLCCLCLAENLCKLWICE